MLDRLPDPRGDDLRAARALILDRVLVATSVIGLFAAVTSVALSITAGLWGLAVMDVVAWSALAVVAARRSWSHDLRAGVLLGAVLLVGVGVLVATGPFGVGLLWLLAVPCLAAVLHDARAFWIAEVAVLVAILAVLGASARGLLGWHDLAEAVGPAWWGMALTSLACLSLGIGLSAVTLVEKLQAAEDERARLRHQLLVAQKMEVVGQMAGGIAHDFNNILTVIQVEGQLARELLDDGGAAAEHVDQLLRACARASDLSSRLLLFTRRRVQPSGPLVVDAEVRSLEPLLARLSGEGHPVRLRLGAGEAAVLADRSHLEQVLTNLVANARDAMPHGGSTEIRTLARSGPDGDRVVLEVADEGIGMEEDVRARVFDPFFTTKPEGQGTGLGLPTVYRIVETLDGAIEVESEPGRGTVFRLSLPVCEARATGAAQEAAAPAPTDRAVTLGGRPAVLLAEDQEAVRRAVRRALERLGCVVTPVSSAEQALELLDRPDAGFDLLLSDVLMPGMTGIELAERVRGRGAGPPILLMSGYVSDPALLQRLDGLEVPILRKPFSPVELLHAVVDRLHLRPPDEVS